MNRVAQSYEAGNYEQEVDKRETQTEYEYRVQQNFDRDIAEVDESENENPLDDVEINDDDIGAPLG